MSPLPPFPFPSFCNLFPSKKEEAFMKKKDISKKDKTTMTASEVGAIIERLEGEFKIFGEGLVALREDVKEVRAAQSSTLERVTMLELLTRKISKDVSEIRDILHTHDRRLTKLEAVGAR